MAKRGGGRSKRGRATRRVRTSNPPPEGSLLRHPSQVLSESSSRKTKSSGPSTTTYRGDVLEQNNIYIISSRDDPQDIELLLESLTNMENTILSHENYFIKNSKDSRIATDEAKLTVSKDIPLRMRQIAENLSELKSRVEKAWEFHVGTPLLSFFNCGELFVDGGAKWSMIYDPPPVEATPLSTPVPDFVCSPRGGLNGIHVALLKKLEEKHIPYSANSTSDMFIYPFLTVEMKSNHSNLFFAENQAGSSVAIALTLLRRLRRAAGSDKQLPVFVLTSQGEMWQIHVCYEQIILDVPSIKISEVMGVRLGNPEGAHRFMVVLDRIKEWAINTYIPTIKEMINCVVSSE